MKEGLIKGLCIQVWVGFRKPMRDGVVPGAGER